MNHPVHSFSDHPTTAEVQETCPWYFEMKALVAERPNVNPVGLGNSITGIDLSALDAEGDDDGTAGSDNPFLTGAGSGQLASEQDDVELPGLSDLEEGQSMSSTLGVGDISDGEEQAEQKPPRTTAPSKRKSSSTPQAPPAKKFKMTGEFSQVTDNMQKTRQKSLDLAIEKERTKAKEQEMKMEYKLRKLSLKTVKEERKHERRLAKYRHEAQMMGSSSHGAVNFSHANSLDFSMDDVNMLPPLSQLPM